MFKRLNPDTEKSLPDSHPCVYFLAKVFSDTFFVYPNFLCEEMLFKIKNNPKFAESLEDIVPGANGLDHSSCITLLRACVRKGYYTSSVAQC